MTTLHDRLNALEERWKSDSLGLTYPMLMAAFNGDGRWLMEAWFDDPLLTPYIREQIRQCFPAWQFQTMAFERLLARAERLVTRLEKVFKEEEK